MVTWAFKRQWARLAIQVGWDTRLLLGALCIMKRQWNAVEWYELWKPIQGRNNKTWHTSDREVYKNGPAEMTWLKSKKVCTCLKILVNCSLASSIPWTNPSKFDLGRALVFSRNSEIFIWLWGLSKPREGIQGEKEVVFRSDVIVLPMASYKQY